MAPLIFLLTSFGVFFLTDRYIFGGRLGSGSAGRAAMAVMLLVTGISHFTSTDLMIETMPDLIPAKREVVYFTGICELLAIPGLLWPRTARITSAALIAFVIAVLPANIVGSLKQVQLGGMEYGTAYLLFRIPLQIFFIWWVWYFGWRVKRT